MNIKRIASILDKNPDLLIRGTILRGAEKGQVIHGAMATNIQLPYYLRKKTKDYDIFTTKPRKSAVEMAKKLNEMTGSKMYKVSKGKHKGTYKIKADGKTVIDYTQLKKKLKTKKVYGIEYHDIKSIKRNVKRLSKKPETEYRREKDISTLQRIKEAERIEKLF